MALRTTCLYCGGKLVDASFWAPGAQACPVCSKDWLAAWDTKLPEGYKLVRGPDPHLRDKGKPGIGPR